MQPGVHKGLNMNLDIMDLHDIMFHSNIKRFEVNINCLYIVMNLTLEHYAK